MVKYNNYINLAGPPSFFVLIEEAATIFSF